MILSSGTLGVTVDTNYLDFGKKSGAVEYKGPSIDKEIPVTVEVTHPVGDVNADYYVDIDDFEAFKKTYSSRKGDGSFAEMADFDGNGSVDAEDFFLFSRFWGE
jgi:hypothetical protein